jgi:hypothetical protein
MADAARPSAALGRGADPITQLLTAAATRDLTSAHDHAAVIDSRIENAGLVAAGGPLPWVPGFPNRIASDPAWGPYLCARSRLVSDLADQVRINAAGEAPAWAEQRHVAVPAELMAGVQVRRTPPRSTYATCDRPGLSSLATPPESSNSNLTYVSRPTAMQMGDGGNCS